LLGAVAVAAGALGALAATSGADGQGTPVATTSETPATAQTAGLTPAEVALLNSGRSINVLMDPNTGDIESVTPAGGGATVASIRHRDAVCDSDDGC
jgi:hypothetical protein